MDVMDSNVQSMKNEIDHNLSLSTGLGVLADLKCQCIQTKHANMILKKNRVMECMPRGKMQDFRGNPVSEVKVLATLKHGGSIRKLRKRNRKVRASSET